MLRESECVLTVTQTLCCAGMLPALCIFVVLAGSQWCSALAVGPTDAQALQAQQRYLREASRANATDSLTHTHDQLADGHVAMRVARLQQAAQLGTSSIAPQDLASLARAELARERRANRRSAIMNARRRGRARGARANRGRAFRDGRQIAERGANEDRDAQATEHARIRAEGAFMFLGKQ